MALTGALFTGLSGLDANSKRLNVVGNNIANANTVGFKGSRVLFSPQFYITSAGGTSPTADTGGTNPNQSGLGTQVSAVEKDFSAGSIQATGKSTDMAIDGAGFFIAQGADRLFTRDGAFTLDSTDNLVTASGQMVQGFGVDSNHKVVPGKLQNINIPLGAASTAQATKTLSMTGNLDTAGATASGASILDSQLLVRVSGGSPPSGNTLLTDVADANTPAAAMFTAGQTFTFQGTKGSRTLPPTTFTVTASSTLGDLTNFFNGGLGVDTTATTDPTEPSPGAVVETDATNPLAARLIVAGNPGNANTLQVDAGSFISGTSSPFTFQAGSNAAGFTNNPSGESIHTSALVYDSLGKPVTLDVTAVYQKSTTSGTQWTFQAESADSKATSGSRIVGTGTLSFDTNGKLITSSGTSLAIDRTGTGAKTPFGVSIDFSGMTALASTSSTMVMNRQDGSPLGSLSAFSIGTDGIITGSFSNGLTRTLGQVAIATFSNPEGLDDKGGNNYAVSANSGTPEVGAPQTLGAGAVRSGALEQSNVDLSTEFVNMIVASTGFSASSKVITTSNQLLQDLLNTTR